MHFTARPNLSALDSPARLGVLTPALRSSTLDATLQQLVADAGRCTGYPLALVTLVLERTTLRRAHHGLPPDLALAQETDRKLSLCQFVVAGGQEVEVYDAQAEPQLPQEGVRRHGIRAYVGLPLRVQGQVVGALCVVDLKPRVLLAHQRIELRSLAARTERRLAALAGGGGPAPSPAPSMEALFERMRERVEAARRAVGATATAPQTPSRQPVVTPWTASPQPVPAPQLARLQPAVAAQRTEEVAYQHTLEGLFHKGLLGRVTPALVARLQPLGLDLSRPLAPTYPRAVYQRVLEATARELWPQLSAERAHEELGRCLVTGYTQTLLGRSILTMMRMLGPRATLGRMQHNLRTGSSYSRAELVEEAPGRCRLWVNEPELNPGLVQGLLDAVLQYSGARSGRVQLSARDARGCTYLVAWED